MVIVVVEIVKIRELGILFIDYFGFIKLLPGLNKS